MTGARKRAWDWRGRALSDLERRELALEVAEAERKRGDAEEVRLRQVRTAPSKPRYSAVGNLEAG
ncbi:MAG: hypothetical protein V1790_17675 [Planctomycetota bacterium]